jgi:hypothetical protein
MEGENSSILKDKSLISKPNQQIQQIPSINQPMQQVLPFPFLPLTPPSPSFLPPLPPVIQVLLLFPPRIKIRFNPIEGPKIYILKPKLQREVAIHKIKTPEKKDEPDYPDDLYNLDIDENNFNIIFENQEDGR